MALLEVHDIHTYYGDSYILQGVSLSADRGQVVAVLGRNGVGKTTLIRSIIGFTPPRQGSITFKGMDITRMPSHRIVRAGMGIVPQSGRIFPSLTVAENLAIASRLRGHGGARRLWSLDKVLALFPRLAERLRQRAEKLSGGEQQMLSWGQALLGNVDLLLMDEPSEGLAPLMVKEVARVIRRLKEEGIAILLVEQNLPLVLGLADRAYVMNKGRVVYEASPDELWRNAEVKARYLGV